MGLISTLRQMNQMFPPPPKHSEKEKKGRVEKIVSKFAQGNVCLQFGRYLSKEDIEQQKSSLASYDFMSRKYS